MIGRSVLIATANPFDTNTVKHVKRLIEHNIFWYVSPPEDILYALRQVHGIDSQKQAGHGQRS